jgi:predicted ribosomally synthesized peptide with SipW-like signal peptide
MRKILILCLAIGVVASMVGVGTFALFSDVETSRNNVFASGTLNMQLSNDPGTPGQPGSSESVTGTWVSPPNWKPGDYFEAALHFNNKGSVAAKHIYFMFHNIEWSGDADLREAIIVTVKERFNNVTTGDQAPYLDRHVGNNDGILTLKEFLSWLPNQYGYYTYDDQSGDGIVLGAMNLWDYDLIFGFRFAEWAGNVYQGASCRFDLTCEARQLCDTEGMICLHESQ